MPSKLYADGSGIFYDRAAAVVPGEGVYKELFDYIRARTALFRRKKVVFCVVDRVFYWYESNVVISGRK